MNIRKINKDEEYTNMKYKKKIKVTRQVQETRMFRNIENIRKIERRVLSNCKGGENVDDEKFSWEKTISSIDKRKNYIREGIAYERYLRLRSKESRVSFIRISNFRKSIVLTIMVK